MEEKKTQKKECIVKLPNGKSFQVEKALEGYRRTAENQRKKRYK